MIRRQVRLASIAEPLRPRLLATLVHRLEAVLEALFPPHDGFEHRTTWTRARHAAGPATEELRQRCLDARIAITRGPRWGVTLDLSPQDFHHQRLWLRVAAAPPQVERMRARALWAGLLLGAAAGIVVEVIWWRQGWRPGRSKTLVAIPGFGMMIGSVLTMTAAHLLRLVHERRLAADLQRADELLLRTWVSLSSDYASLPPLEERQSPTLRHAQITAACAIVAALGYWGFWAIEPVSSARWLLAMAIGVTGVVAAFGALLFGLFTYFEFVGMEPYRSGLKTTD